MNSKAVSLREQARQYELAWQQELSTIESPEVRKISEERQAAAAMRFVRINAANKTVEELIGPYLVRLKDLRIALGNDLNAGGIGALGPIMSKVDTESELLKSRVAAAIQEMTSAEAVLAPNQGNESPESSGSEYRQGNWRYSVGVTPVVERNARVKALWSQKPHAWAISAMD